MKCAKKDRRNQLVGDGRGRDGLAATGHNRKLGFVSIRAAKQPVIIIDYIQFVRYFSSMDAHDKEILQLLQSDNRMSNASIGREVGLSVSAVNERVRRLNTTGIVRANRADVDPGKVGLGLCAFLLVDLDTGPDSEDDFVAGAVALPEVQEVHHITGRHNYLLKVRVADTEGLQVLLSEKLKHLPGLLRTESTVVLRSYKETTALPISTRDER